MEKLNELVELAKKADYKPCRAHDYALAQACSPANILAIAEAFRSLEQRAEAAEAELREKSVDLECGMQLIKRLERQVLEYQANLEKENKWRDLALQFDGHRMQAISLLKMIVNDAPAEQFTSVRNFLKSGPLSGEEVMNERLLAIANCRPAPAINLAELVPKQVSIRQAIAALENHEYCDTPASGYKAGVKDTISAILRNIEETK